MAESNRSRDDRCYPCERPDARDDAGIAHDDVGAHCLDGVRHDGALPRGCIVRVLDERADSEADDGLVGSQSNTNGPIASRLIVAAIPGRRLPRSSRGGDDLADRPRRHADLHRTHGRRALRAGPGPAASSGAGRRGCGLLLAGPPASAWHSSGAKARDPGPTDTFLWADTRTGDTTTTAEVVVSWVRAGTRHHDALFTAGRQSRSYAALPAFLPAVPFSSPFCGSRSIRRKQRDPGSIGSCGRWRDPDSNRGHHDFQSCGRGWPDARNRWKPRDSPLARAPGRSPLFTSFCTEFRRWRRLISSFRRRLERRGRA